MLVSIRAPVKGATSNAAQRRAQRRCFDPRSREGSDVEIREQVRCALHVSIRAPVKGATVLWGPRAKREGCFDPRPREGSDARSHDAIQRHRGFDPRSREGSDATELDEFINPQLVSIRAPVKGATLSTTSTALALSRFDPRPREGSDLLSDARRCSWNIIYPTVSIRAP